ncbi:MAG: hypothetical protein P8I93_09865 [Crocinitomicaceae bacterium]|nr:hypothetical protein [Crocinitomicaceae bacterium]
MKVLFICILFLFVTTKKNFSQDCEKVLFIGNVVDTFNTQSFYNLMVINRSDGRGTFGQPNGQFSVYVNINDKISLSVKGYEIINYRIKKNKACRIEKKFVLKPKIQEIEEVVIRPLKTLNQIKEERASLALRETRIVTGVNMLQSPITALYQAFSKKEKAKRWIAEQEYKDNQRKVVKELLRLYVSYKIIDLNEGEFDAFIAFLNLNSHFLKTATEMELIVFIKDKYEHFISIK